MHLKVPVQICAEGSDTGIQEARARSVEETAIRAAMAEEFSPRSFTNATGGGEEVGRSTSLGARGEMPPGYEAFAPPTTRYSVSHSIVT
jgi:hypothetical protein